MSEVSHFRRADRAGPSSELLGPCAAKPAGPTPEWSGQLSHISLLAADESLPLVSFAGSRPGVWVLNEAARLNAASRSRLLTPTYSAQIGEGFGNALGDHWQQVLLAAVDGTWPDPGVDTAPTLTSPRGGERNRAATAGQKICPTGGSPHLPARCARYGGACRGRGHQRRHRRAQPQHMGPILALLEMNAGLGGTGTYGGVHSYWFGRRVGFAARVTESANQLHSDLNHRPAQGSIPKWNIEIKAESLRSTLEQTDAALLTNASVFAVLTAGNRVSGVLAATRLGPVAVLGQVIVDASGDGDIAAFAGAETVYGAERDHVTMWYSWPSSLSRDSPATTSPVRPMFPTWWITRGQFWPGADVPAKRRHTSTGPMLPPERVATLAVMFY